MSALKLRSKVNFPATVTATGGIAVAKSNGIWRVEPDWSYLTLEVTVPNPSGRQLWTYDPNADVVYYRLSVQALIDNLPAGPPGAAATLAAGTTTTGKAGTNASVTNSGTSSAAVFDVTVPRGADAGMRYNFETSTSMAAPASGGIRLNNASLASVTAIAVNASDAGGIDACPDFVATWDDSTNAVKGYVEVRKEGSGAALGLFSITSVTDNTSWLQVSVSYVSGSGSFSASDPVYLIPYRTGNKGADGAGAGTGDFSSDTATSVVNEVVLFSDTSGKTGKRATGTGIAKLASGVLGTATAGTDYYNPGGTDVAIADGGTGQSTATAGFNALSPTTTRGDIITRGASNNQRLALGTSGYLLSSDGTDAVWSGFLQAGTSAVTRTWQNKIRERLSVKDFGAVGDGVTNDQPAIALAETARAAIGGILVFPAGTYLCNSSVSVNRANGGGWEGEGAVVLKAGANSVVFCSLTGAVISSSTRGFRFTGFTVDGAGFTGVRGIHEVSPYNTTVDNCTFINVAYCMSVVGPNSTAQTGWVFISNIQQYGQGSWAFYGYNDTRYIFNIVIQGVHQKGTGSTNWENDFWFEGRRSVGLSMSNVWSGSLDGDVVGLRLRGDCQGVFVNNTTFVWPTIGIEALTWTDTLKPAYVYLTNIGVDQHTVSGAEIEGRTWFITNANFANGYVRTNTGQACLLKSTCTDISIVNALFAYDQKSGLVVQNGAKKIRVGNFTAENNNQAAGSNYEVDLGASPFTDVILHGRNVIGSAGVNATGQRVVNGVTSKEVSRNTGFGATTAVTTIEDLMTYTIPANTLKPGQRVRLLAWGKTAANANTKTMRMYFGATSIGGLSGNYNNLDWRVETNIYITGSNTQEYERQGVASAGNNSANGTMTETDTSAITVKITGQNGTASAGDITAQGFTVEIID